MKILLPVDGSRVTRRMLNYLAAHEELLGPMHAYTLLTVILPVPAFAANSVDRETLDNYYFEQAETVFRPIRSFTQQQGWPARLEHLSGDPALTIAAIAEAERYDLVVMGTHGHSALGNVLLGSVASGVLARCKIPVLLVR